VKPGTLSPYTWNGYDVVAALIAQVKAVAIKGSDGNLYIPRGALVNAVRNFEGLPGPDGRIYLRCEGRMQRLGPPFGHHQDGKWVVAE